MNKTRCIHCGKKIEYYGFCCPTMCDECNKEWLTTTCPKTNLEYQTIKYLDDYSVGEPCLICGEMVATYGNEARYKCYKVCNKCKKAVMKMRETIEHEGKGETK